MTKPTVSIDGIVYKSKAALEVEARSRIPKAYSQNIEPMVLDEFWLELFSYSVDFADKAEEFGEDLILGYRLNPFDSGRTVGLVLTNSTRTIIKPVGWLACARAAFMPGQPLESLDKRIRVGFRAAIKPQIDAFRRSKITDGDLYCEVTGNIFPANEIHIDHHPKDFEQIVCEFLDALPDGTVFEGCLTKTHAGDPWHNRFKDRDVDRWFQQYHQAAATLRAVHFTANLSKPKWSKAA